MNTGGNDNMPDVALKISLKSIKMVAYLFEENILFLADCLTRRVDCKWRKPFAF